MGASASFDFYWPLETKKRRTGCRSWFYVMIHDDGDGYGDCNENHDDEEFLLIARQPDCATWFLVVLLMT